MTFVVTEYRNERAIHEEEYDRFEDVLDDLEESATTEYRNSVAAWAIAGAREPLRIANGDIIDVWTKSPLRPSPPEE